MLRLNKKKGVSVLIGYVLLTAFVVIMGGVVFTWLKTYVPQDSLSCPDSVSLFIKEYTLDCENYNLNITLKNNGRFSYSGFFIRASNISGDEIAILDFSQFLEETAEIKKLGNAVSYLGSEDNPLKPGEESIVIFDYAENSSIGSITSLTIIPTRSQTEDNRKRLVSCDTARLNQRLICGTESPPIPDLELIIGSCDIPTDSTMEALCVGRVCGTVENISSSGSVSCGTITCPPDSCAVGEGCNDMGQCEVIPPQCGINGINSPEQCDDGINNGVECVPSYGSSCDYCSSLCEIVTVLGPYCGDNTINGIEGCDAGTNNGVACDPPYGGSCNYCSSSCTTSTVQGPFCGDGVITSPEICDDGDSQSGDGCSNTCQVEIGWSCVGDPTPPPASICTTGGGGPSCANYCVSLGLGYTSSGCYANNGQCISNLGDPKSGGDSQCVSSGAPSGSTRCCCFPAVA